MASPSAVSINLSDPVILVSETPSASLTESGTSSAMSSTISPTMPSTMSSTMSSTVSPPQSSGSTGISSDTSDTLKNTVSLTTSSNSPQISSSLPTLLSTLAANSSPTSLISVASLTVPTISTSSNIIPSSLSTMSESPSTTSRLSSLFSPQSLPSTPKSTSQTVDSLEDIPISSTTSTPSTSDISSSSISDTSTILEEPSLTISSFDPSSFKSTSTAYTSIWTNGGTTLTSVVLIPTTVPIKSPVERNARVIGGVVGSIGGALVITAVVALFVVWRRRKSSSLTNQLPDFQDGLGLERDIKGVFEPILSAELTPRKWYRFSALLASLLSRSNSHKNRLTSLYIEKTPVVNDGISGARDEQTEVQNGFYYRGIAKSNNLEQVFRSATVLDRASSTGHTTTTATIAFLGPGNDELFSEQYEERNVPSPGNSCSQYSRGDDFCDVIFTSDPVAPLPYPTFDMNIDILAESHNSKSIFAEQID